jgi:hypothetical protein
MSTIVVCVPWLVLKLTNERGYGAARTGIELVGQPLAASRRQAAAAAGSPKRRGRRSAAALARWLREQADAAG